MRSRRAAQAMFEQEFHGLTLAFDASAAGVYATIVARCSRNGTPMSVEDAQIAAIASHHGLPLATRNTRNFAKVPGLVLIDPWQAA